MADRVIRGILGKKLGMTQVFDAANRIVPVTVVQAGPCIVTQVRTADRDGYSAVQLAFGEIDPRRVPKPLRGHFEKAGVTPRRHVVELRTVDASSYTVGSEVTAQSFAPGTYIDVVGHQQGQGQRRRHEATRLQGPGLVARRREEAPLTRLDRRLRHARSRLQGCASMAGRMGGERTTTMNLVIHAVDAERGLILVRGAIPGPDGGLDHGPQRLPSASDPRLSSPGRVAQR